MHATFWKGRRVFISGHTGFTGSWLVLWLRELGAECCGYALTPPSSPNLYTLGNVAEGIRSLHGDIRDMASLEKAMCEFEPQVIFHLAAQALVLHSYKDPIGTYTTNVIGTLNMLEAARKSGSANAFVNVTSDKCYANMESTRGYREDDRLGGSDPYSSSKACAELASAAYRSSYLAQMQAGTTRMAMATVRAGNIIGGGDWGTDRLIPDIVRAYASGGTMTIRHPEAVRPWQHVLDALSGYILLAERLAGAGEEYAEAWNFGADPDSELTVAEIVDAMRRRWGEGFHYEVHDESRGAETSLLKLDSSKSHSRLGWKNRIPPEKCMDLIAEWYEAWRTGRDMRTFTLEQIRAY